METLKVSIHECRDKEVLAADIYNNKGVVLAAKDTVINKFIKERLAETGINDIYIYSASKGFSDSSRNFKISYTEAVHKIKSLLNDLAAGKLLDYEKVKHVTSQIYLNIQKNALIINCLQEIRRTDEYTYTHCLNTAFYSMLIGKWLKFTDEELVKVIQAGLLHDIGKTRIPAELLNKKSILTKAEYELIKEHAVLGFELLKDVDDIDADIKLAVLHHHERVDCSGYPYRASPEKVNLFAKIIAVADVFDAMTSNRVYKKRVTPFDAFEMFKTVGVGIFDTTVLSTFIKNIVHYYTGFRVLLSDGSTAEIAYIPPHDITSPIVLINSEYVDLSCTGNLKIIEMV